MEYPIHFQPGDPDFDTLPILKLVCLPSVPVAERYFAQAQLGRNEATLFVRIASFEVRPAPEATVTLRLCHRDNTLLLGLHADGSSFLTCNGTPYPAEYQAKVTTGADLQGEYWAGLFSLPWSVVEAALGYAAGLSFPLEGNLWREHPSVSSALPLSENLTFQIKG